MVDYARNVSLGARAVGRYLVGLLMKGGNFLPFWTECVMRLYSGETLSVGLQLITEDAAGLKVVPTHCIVFALGPADNPQEKAFDLLPVTARTIGKRILEMCDEADRLNREGK